MVLSSYDTVVEEVSLKNGSSYYKTIVVPREVCLDIPREVSRLEAGTVLAPYQVQCPGNGNCSNQGICDVLTGTCSCNPGYQGFMCQGKNSIQITNVHP